VIACALDHITIDQSRSVTPRATFKLRAGVRRAWRMAGICRRLSRLLRRPGLLGSRAQWRRGAAAANSGERQYFSGSRHRWEQGRAVLAALLAR
jgi:hypothetical protein